MRPSRERHRATCNKSREIRRLTSALIVKFADDVGFRAQAVCLAIAWYCLASPWIRFHATTLSLRRPVEMHTWERVAHEWGRVFLGAAS